MYGAERLNKYLKGLLKNKGAPLQSIVKNYSLMEKITMFTNHKLENLERLFKVTDLPNRTLIDKFSAAFKDIYVESHEKENGEIKYELHGIQAQRVIQFMGPSTTIRLNSEQVSRLLHAAAERVDDEDCLLYCLVQAWEEHRKTKTQKQKQDLVQWISSFDDIPYDMVPNGISRSTVLDDWKQILDLIDKKTILVRKDAMIGGSIFTSKYWNTKTTSMTLKVKPLMELLSKNSMCRPDSFISFLCEKSPTEDDYRFGRAIYFFRLSLTNSLDQHPFVYVDHIKSEKVYSNLSSPQCTILDITDYSWTRKVLDDNESGRDLNVFLSCYSLRSTNIAVCANPIVDVINGEEDNRRKKVAFCCMDLGRIWPGCSDSSLLDARRFDIEETTPVYPGSIRDTSNDHISFPQLCNSGIPRMVIDYVIACRKVDS
jgi:hypothetical protein